MKKNASTESIGAKRWLAVFFAFSLVFTLLIFLVLAMSSTLHGLLSPLACNPGEALEWSASGTGNSVDYAYCCIGGRRGCVWTQDGVLDEGPGSIVMLASFIANLPFSLAATLAVPRRFMLMVR